MAKSSLSQSRSHDSGKDIDAQLKFPPIPTIINFHTDRIKVRFDISVLFHTDCNKSNKKTNDKDRIHYVSAFIKNIDKSYKAGDNQVSIYRMVSNLKRYFIFCDELDLLPFSESALEAFHNELVSKCAIYNNRKPFLFQYANGEKLGIKEITASGIINSVREALEMCGYPAYSITSQFIPMRYGDEVSYEALSDNERNVFLKKIQQYFFELSAQLLANDGKEPPNELYIKVNETKIFIGSISRVKKRTGDFTPTSEPLNMAMVAAYLLLTFYSGFNESQTLDLGRELKIDKSKSRSNHKFYNIEAKKPRAGGKMVKATIGGHIDKNSWKFIKTLIDLSDKYDTENSGLLLYQKSRKGNIQRLSPTKGVAYLRNDLFLINDNALMVAKHLSNQYIDIATKKKMLMISLKKENLSTSVIKRWGKVKQPQKIAPVIAFSVLSVISGLGENLKGILNDLKINKISGGKIEVFYIKDDGLKGKFICDSFFLKFLNTLVDYNNNLKYIPNNRYLIIFGSRISGFRQWEGLSPKSLLYYLEQIGVRANDYFMPITSSRLRETYARIGRNNGESDDVIALILNNTLSTVLKHYSTGNRDESRKVMDEALRILNNIVNGKDLNDAIKSTLSDLKIPILSIRDPNFNKGKINAAGFHCNGENKPNSHKVTGRRAVKLGIDTAKLPCFQYDKCLECKSAKLVDDEEALYRSLSCAESIAVGAEYFPEQYEALIRYSDRLKNVISHNFSKKKVNKLLDRIDDEGLHPLYINSHAIAGMHINKGNI